MRLLLQFNRIGGIRSLMSLRTLMTLREVGDYKNFGYFCTI